MHLVGITGPIGHGKTSFAKALQSQVLNSRHFESGDLIVETVEAWRQAVPQTPPPGDLKAINEWLATLVPVIAQKFSLKTTAAQLAISQTELRIHPEMFQKLTAFLTLAQQQPELQSTPISEANKAQFRPLLQWLGGYLVTKVSKGIWYEELVNRSLQAQLDGIELCVIGGLRFINDAAVLRAASAVIVGIQRPGQTDLDTSDPTEAQRRQIQVDTTVLNNGSLAQLSGVAAEFYQDLSANRLKKIYQAQA